MFNPLQEAETIVAKIKQQQYQELLRSDQLTMERNEQRVFLHYGEKDDRETHTEKEKRERKERIDFHFNHI